MTPVPLQTILSGLLLIAPDVERDAPLSIAWLRGAEGRNTLRLMGVADKDNRPTTLEAERERVQSFITRTDQFNWMMQCNGEVFGSICVDLLESGYLPAPSIHLMIGAPGARAQGIGQASVQAVTKHLTYCGYNDIYSRYVLNNHRSTVLFSRLNFKFDGSAYTDTDNLTFQNVRLHIKTL